MSLWVDSHAARPRPEPDEVTLSLVNSVSSRRAQKSGQDAPKLISRPSREAFLRLKDLDQQARLE